MADAALVAAGAAVCGVAAFLWRGDHKKHRAHQLWCTAAAHTEGVVSRVARRGHLSRNEPTSSDEFFEVPIIKFRAADGVEYEIDAPDAPQQIGSRMAVAYDPALPSSARPIPRTRKLGCTVAFFAVGLFLIGWGLVG